MASTFTPNLNLEQPGFRDYVDTWHIPVNSNMNVIDEAVGWTANQITRFIYADETRIDAYTANGSRAKPFKTIQTAISHAEANMTPSFSNPVVIRIMPGIYVESLTIKKSGVHLQGLGGQGACRVQTASGVNTRPTLTITNATTASLTTFYNNDGRNDPMGQYGNLIADVVSPLDNQFRDIMFGDPSLGTVYDILIIGVGNSTTFLNSEANFMRVTCAHSIFVRTANYIKWQYSFCGNSVRMHNVAKFIGNSCQVGSNFELSYNVANQEPSDAGNFGLNGSCIDIKGVLRTSDSARTGYDHLVNIQVGALLSIENTSSCYINNGYVSGNVSVSGDADFRFRNIHVQGNMTLINAGGLDACQFDGGKIVGTISDTGARLTVHDYNPGNVANWAGAPPTSIAKAIDRLANKVAANHGPV